MPGRRDYTKLDQSFATGMALQTVARPKPLEALSRTASLRLVGAVSRRATALNASAETDGGLPDEGQQKEKQRNDREDVDQRTESLIGLWKLGQQIK